MRLMLGSKTLGRLLEEVDVSVRLNQMSGDGEWAEGATRHDPLSPLWEKITKYPGSVLLGHVRSRAAPNCSAWSWRMSLRRLLDISVANPFQEWLATLPPWDGEPRLDLMLHRALDVDNGESFRFHEELAPAARDSNARLIGDLSRYCRT